VDLHELQEEIRRFLSRDYPNIEVRAERWANDPSRLGIYFVEEKFASLYPAQRYHYLRHLIPEDFYNQHLADTEWFELAPGEQPGDLEYPDNELIDDITPDVMRVLTRAKVFDALDDALCPENSANPRKRCFGDYRNARSILLSRGFKEKELFDVFHVLMARGGYCDCEILYNAVESSRLKAEYWRARAENIEPYDPHAGPPT